MAAIAQKSELIGEAAKSKFTARTRAKIDRTTGFYVPHDKREAAFKGASLADVDRKVARLIEEYLFSEPDKGDKTSEVHRKREREEISEETSSSATRQTRYFLRSTRARTLTVTTQHDKRAKSK